MDGVGQREEPKLKQELRWWQILFIVISAVIGEGIYYNSGPALEVAGPAGLLVAFFVVSFVTICVMEGISEFTQLFPAPNAVYEYVRAFVDEDLAWVVGIAYWYTFAAVFAYQNIAAGDHAIVFMGDAAATWQTVGFYIIGPIVLTIINLCGVKWYGWIETVGGALKIFLVLMCAILLYVIAGSGGVYCPEPDQILQGALDSPSYVPCSNETTSIDIIFAYNEQYVNNKAEAVLFAIPIVLYSYLSIECFVVTAYEAKTPTDLRRPSKWIAYIVFILYFLCTLAEALTVRWYDRYLPPVYAGLAGVSAPLNPALSSSTLVIIAAARARVATIQRTFPNFLSGCLIFSNLSAANTSLYLASRTLYGLAREIPTRNKIGRFFHKLSVIEPRTGVPVAALITSTLSFLWLPFLRRVGRGSGSVPSDETIQVISASTSVCTLIVWGVLSLAFIRYTQWLDKCEKSVRERLPELDRKSIAYPHHTIFRQLQPVPAYIGLIGCILCFACASGNLWKRARPNDAGINISNAASAYGAPIILVAVYICLKLARLRKRRNNKNRWGWVSLSPNSSDLEQRLWRLRWNKHVKEEHPEGNSEPVGHGLRRRNWASPSHDSLDGVSPGEADMRQRPQYYEMDAPQIHVQNEHFK